LARTASFRLSLYQCVMPLLLFASCLRGKKAACLTKQTTGYKAGEQGIPDVVQRGPLVLSALFAMHLCTGSKARKHLQAQLPPGIPGQLAKCCFNIPCTPGGTALAMSHQKECQSGLGASCIELLMPLNTSYWCALSQCVQAFVASQNVQMLQQQQQQASQASLPSMGSNGFAWQPGNFNVDLQVRSGLVMRLGNVVLCSPKS